MRELVLTERNVRIDIGVGLFALFLCALLQVRGKELALVIVCIVLQIALEGLNTALEGLVDQMHPEKCERARRAKDIAAGSVLACALGCVGVGLIIFVPKALIVFTHDPRLILSRIEPIVLMATLTIVYSIWAFLRPLTLTRESDDSC